MRIGLISDTHCPQRCLFYPAAIGRALQGVDLILHAGDVGRLWVLDALGSIAPVIAVHGNDDTQEAQLHLPYEQIVNLRGIRILLAHSHEREEKLDRIDRATDAWEPKLARRLERARPAGAAIMVHGHTHIPMHWSEEGVSLINPGAIASCGAKSRQKVQSVAILEIDALGDCTVRHVDLADPDARFVPEIDLASGFEQALSRFSECITDAVLEERLTRDWLLALEDFEAFRECFLGLSRECWAGARALVTADALREAVQRDAAVCPTDRERLDGLLAT